MDFLLEQMIQILKKIDSNIYKIFSDEFVNFSIRFDNNLNNAVLKIRKSGVELWFENTSENDMCIPSEYQLVAIGLSHHDFDIFERNF